jgi:hypothetical protein
VGAAGYRWLKYVPNGLLKTAQAAEWRLQAWMLGKPPTVVFRGIGFDARAPLAHTNTPPRTSGGGFSDYDDLADFDGRFDSRSTLGGARRSHDRAPPPPPPPQGKRGLFGRLRRASAAKTAAPAPERDPDVDPGGSLRSHAASTPSLGSPPPSPAPYAAGSAHQAALANALIAAAHAEAARGVHGDLLRILNHAGRPWGFASAAYPHALRVWLGARDDKVGAGGVRWMEKAVGPGRCAVELVPGADHALMYNSAVVVQALEHVREAWPL